tara:strand:- start:359 stop:979 length:621 start_codon:yes stop_codon:yes gene_type:complete
MTLGEARNLLDILVDKANNPYFTIPEKDEFLQLAVTDFIEKYYTVYDINEQSRAALKGLVTSLLSGTGNATITLPNDLIYSLSLSVQYWHPNRLAQRDKEYSLAKQVSAAQFRHQADPFNRHSYDDPVYTYVASAGGVSQIHILPSDSIQNKLLYYIQRPTLAEVFTSGNPMIEELYQNEIVQVAARKMLANIESSNYEVQSQEAE